MNSENNFYLVTYLNEGFKRKQSLVVKLERESHKDNISRYLFKRLDYNLNPLIENGKRQYIVLDSSKIHRMESVFLKKTSDYKEIVQDTRKV